MSCLTCPRNLVSHLSLHWPWPWEGHRAFLLLNLVAFSQLSFSSSSVTCLSDSVAIVLSALGLSGTHPNSSNVHYLTTMIYKYLGWPLPSPAYFRLLTSPTQLSPPSPPPPPIRLSLIPAQGSYRTSPLIDSLSFLLSSRAYMCTVSLCIIQQCELLHPSFSLRTGSIVDFCISLSISVIAVVLNLSSAATL